MKVSENIRTYQKLSNSSNGNYRTRTLKICAFHLVLLEAKVHILKYQIIKMYGEVYIKLHKLLCII